MKKGDDWNDLDPILKRGRGITKVPYNKNGTVRFRWESTEVPTFSKYRRYIKEFFPQNMKPIVYA